MPFYKIFTYFKLGNWCLRHSWCWSSLKACHWSLYKIIPETRLGLIIKNENWKNTFLVERWMRNVSISQQICLVSCILGFWLELVESGPTPYPKKLKINHGIFHRLDKLARFVHFFQSNLDWVPCNILIINWMPSNLY